jgi:hypothetical protein
MNIVTITNLTCFRILIMIRLSWIICFVITITQIHILNAMLQRRNDVVIIIVIT